MCVLYDAADPVIIENLSPASVDDIGSEILEDNCEKPSLKILNILQAWKFSNRPTAVRCAHK